MRGDTHLLPDNSAEARCSTFLNTQPYAAKNTRPMIPTDLVWKMLLSMLKIWAST